MATKAVSSCFFAMGDKNGMLRPYQRIAGAILQMWKDIDAEQALPCYLDEKGSFLASFWEWRWSGKNRWEVWRELGKEHYHWL
jgi:hypothetical protein